MMNKNTLIRTMKKMDLLNIFKQFKRVIIGFNLNTKII